MKQAEGEVKVSRKKKGAEENRHRQRETQVEISQ